MKNILLVLGLFMCALVANGQPYKSIFASDTTRWNVFEYEIDGGGTYAYESFSDTLINNKIYHKLYWNKIQAADGELGAFTKFCGFIHEDTLQGKYWFRGVINKKLQELIFMDFSLKKGDYFTIVKDFRDMRIDSFLVDSVYYDNFNRKNISFAKSQEFSPNDFKFIEGIGSSNGFYLTENQDLPFNPEYFTLMCKYENNLQTYTTDNIEFSNCYHEGGGSVEDVEFGNSISVYPNPSLGKISLKIENINSPLNYTIFNNLGQVISEGKLYSNINELELNEKGVLHIKISNNQFHSIKKITNIK